MMKKVLLGVVTVIASITLFFGAPEVVQAQGGLVPCTNNCQICHLVQLLVNIMQLILGSIGSLTLLMFVLGGFWWLISAGRSGYVEKGKTTIINAIIGLAIVFLSYSIITFVIMGLSGATSEANIQIFGQQWGEFIDCPLGTIPENTESSSPAAPAATPVTQPEEAQTTEPPEPSSLNTCTTNTGETGRCLTVPQQRIFQQQGTEFRCGDGVNICGQGIDCCTGISN